MLVRIFCFICFAFVFLPETEGSWWSSDTEETTSTTEDAECDWSLDGEMGPDTTYGGYDGTGTGYTPNNAGNGYILNSDGTGYIQQNAGNGYTQQNAGNGYAQQNAGNGYAQQNAGTGYTQQKAGIGYIQQTGGSGYAQQSAGNGYTQQNAGNGYAQQNAGNGYPQQTGGTAYAQQNAGNGYVQSSGGTAYIPQSGVTGYVQTSGGNGYAQTSYAKRSNGVGSATSSSYITPQSQQRVSPRQISYLNQYDYVGLHPRLAIGTYVTVTNPELQRTVVVKIVGRPKDLAVGRCLTLSKIAFQQIADLSDGVTHCIVAPAPTS